MPAPRPSLAWLLTVAAMLAAAVVGLASWVYAKVLENHLDEGWQPIPEHVHWMIWLGIILMILGGLGALTMLALRHRALRRSAV